MALPSIVQDILNKTKDKGWELMDRLALANKLAAQQTLNTYARAQEIGESTPFIGGAGKEVSKVIKDAFGASNRLNSAMLGRPDQPVSLSDATKIARMALMTGGMATSPGYSLAAGGLGAGINTAITGATNLLTGNNMDLGEAADVGFGRGFVSGATFAPFGAVSNKVLATALAKTPAGNLASSRVAQGFANVVEDLAFDKATGRKTTPTEMATSFAVGAAMKPFKLPDEVIDLAKRSVKEMSDETGAVKPDEFAKLFRGEGGDLPKYPGGSSGPGVYFSRSKQMAQAYGGNLVEIFDNTPLKNEAGEITKVVIKTQKQLDDLTKKAIESGFDGNNITTYLKTTNPALQVVDFKLNDELIDVSNLDVGQGGLFQGVDRKYFLDSQGELKQVTSHTGSAFSPKGSSTDKGILLDMMKQGKIRSTITPTEANFEMVKPPNVLQAQQILNQSMLKPVNIDVTSEAGKLLESVKLNNYQETLSFLINKLNIKL